MNTVAIVDYGVSNLDSVARAVQECGGDPMVTRDPAALDAAARVILPGVGVFAEGMRRLEQQGFVAALRDRIVAKGIPLLGICLGMQMLATRGHEGGTSDGLGFIPGEVVRLEACRPGERVPHVGWNSVEIANSASPLFRGMPDGLDFYFVHSWHLRCASAGQIVARTPFCGGFVSAAASGLVFGVQFHPEKSQRAGFRLLRNFLAV